MKRTEKFMTIFFGSVTKTSVINFFLKDLSIGFDKICLNIIQCAKNQIVLSNSDDVDNQLKVIQRNYKIMSAIIFYLPLP